MLASPATSTATEILGCSDCGLVQLVPEVPSGTAVSCRRCDSPFRLALSMEAGSIFALTLAAALLSLCALFSPIFIVQIHGNSSHELIQSNISAFWTSGYWPMALLVAGYTLLAPMAWYSLMIFVFGSLMSARRPIYLGPAFRISQSLESWAMLDVFMVAAMVAYRRLSSMVMVSLGTGGWCLAAAAGLIFTLRAAVDPQKIWDAIPCRDGMTPSAGGDSTPTCPYCSLVVDPAGHRRCPRCWARIAPEVRDLQVPAALTMAAFVLYIPANLLPVMRVTHFGWSETSTIMAGVRDLYEWGMWPLAVIIFVASIAIPLLKLFGLTWCIAAIRWRASSALLLRTKLYRVIDRIGRWSNIDVFVLSTLLALLQFGNLASVRAEPGSVAFAAVVVLTLGASRAFDPRLMWQFQRDKL
jgi:paraquat-inducible protein A